MVNHYMHPEGGYTLCRHFSGVLADAVSVKSLGYVTCPECLDRVDDPDGEKSDPVNHPSHYTQYPVEVIEITERLSFLMGNVVKYVLRADHKGEPIQDLEKARWYLDREIARRKRA